VDCPYLWCRDDWGFGRYFGLLFPPALFGVAWLFVGRAESPLRQPEKPKFLLRKVTLAEFSKGLRGTRQRTIEAPFQNYFPFAPRLSHLLLQMLRNTLLSQSLCHSFRLGFFMSLFYQMLHISPAVLDNIQYKVLIATLEDGKRLSSALKTSVGILFSFYALGRVGWWWTVIDWCRSMQGRTHDIGLIIGGYTAVKECPQAGKASKKEQWLEAKWNLYRLRKALLHGVPQLAVRVGAPAEDARALRHCHGVPTSAGEVDDLLVCKHSTQRFAPIHGLPFLVREAFVEQLQEDPLRPL